MIDHVERSAELLAGTARVVVLTGAGMSKESGVPTFRDALTGLWSRYDPQELATEAAFRRNPPRVFGWYMERWRLTRRVEPHAGHHALVRLADAFDELCIATQNVDGLHRRAGSEEVVELHGAIDAFRCLDRGHPYDAQLVEAVEAAADGTADPPACPICGSPIRPGVVWYGEALPEAALERAWHAVEQCDGLLAIGTSALVYPAADLPRLAMAHGALVVEMNPDRTPLTSSVDLWWPAPAGQALPALAARLGRPVQQ